MPENDVTTSQQPGQSKRQWRVGTFSMGTMLIVFGLVLLLAQFKKFTALEIVATWWPAVLIILGLEILAAVYFSGEERPVIKYDFLSIFMVLLIGGMTFGLYALTSVGILPALVETVSSRTFSVDVSEQRFGLQDGVKNIVVNTLGCQYNISSFSIRETDGNEAVAFAQVNVSAGSRSSAEDLVPDNLVKARTVGDTLFLDFQTVPSGNQFQQPPRIDYTIVLPRDRNVQVDSDAGPSLRLQVNDLENNWAVNCSGTVEVTVAADADVKVEAFARRLGGEAQWIQANGGHGSEEQVLIKGPDGTMIFESAHGEYSEAKGNGSITFGKGSHKLEITADEVHLNDI